MRTPARRDRGALTLELVIVFPALLLTLMIIAQAAVAYMAQQAALAAARQGVEAARVLNAPAGAGPAAALQFARTVASGYLTHATATGGGGGPTDQITVTGVVPSLVPGLVIHVSETAQAPVERFTTKVSGFGNSEGSLAAGPSTEGG